MALDGAGGDGYPAFAEFTPTETIETSHYQVRFAADRRDLEAVQRLRYRVFNLELGEGLDVAHAIGRDEDPFDRCCHHLMVISKVDQQVIGTYRMQTSGMAGAGRGFYCDTLFDLSGEAYTVDVWVVGPPASQLRRMRCRAMFPRRCAGGRSKIGRAHV